MVKKHLAPQVQSLIVLLKLDAEGLYNRLSSRKLEYLHIFSVKRTREHFVPLFRTRYWDIPARSLHELSSDCLVAVEKFYSLVEGMQWYLNTTEQMPGTVEERVEGFLKKMEDAKETLLLFLNAELGIDPSEAQTDYLETQVEPSEGKNEMEERE